MMIQKYQIEPFLKAYEKINQDHREFTRAIERKDLLISEKKLLKSLMLIKRAKIEAAQEALQSFQPPNQFLEGFFLYVKGLLYIHQGKFKLSAKNLVKALELLSTFEVEELILKPIQVLARNYYNLADLKRLEKYYHVFLEFGFSSAVARHIDYEYKIFISLLKNEKEKCLQLIDSLCEELPEQVKFNLAMYELLRFQLFAKNKDFDSCYKSYHRYKNINGYKVKSNQKFMITLLNNLTKQTAVYAYKQDHQDNIYLYYQLKLIRELQAQNKQEAESAWNQLKQLSPDLYGDYYKYKGEKGLFSIALAKQLEHLNEDVLSVDQKILNQCKTPGKKLEYLLKNHKQYIDAEDLISLIWQEKWSPHNLTRLRTLVSRLRKKEQLQIDVKDGKYKLVS